MHEGLSDQQNQLQETQVRQKKTEDSLVGKDTFRTTVVSNALSQTLRYNHRNKFHVHGSNNILVLYFSFVYYALQFKDYSVLSGL